MSRPGLTSEDSERIKREYDEASAELEANDSRSSTCSLPRWIASVRAKFRLPWGDIPATENWNAKEKEYWEGYEACLLDLEKQLESAPDPATSSADVLSAAMALVGKIKIIHGLPAYRSVWQSAQAHQGRYTGPTYEKELDAMAKAIDDEHDRIFRGENS